MSSRAVERTEAEKQAWTERVRQMLTWPECDGCKKRKEWLANKLKGLVNGANH